MPIRHFDFFCSERQLLGSESLSLLKDCRIGIEGHYWLRKILKPGTNHCLDQILASVVATGGSLSYETLSQIINKELDSFKAYGITPFFVFNGLAVKRDKPFSFEDLRPSKRDMAWSSYQSGRYDAAQDSWLKSNSLNQTDYIQLVFQILNEAGVEFMRAPYSVWGQLTYLEQHPKQLVHAVYAGSEMIMWDVDRVILSFDFVHGTFSFIDKVRVLNDLGVSPDTFLEIAIMAGFDWIPTFPVLALNFSFKSAVECAQNTTVLAYADHPQVLQMGYIDMYFRIRTTIRHHLVLTEEGRVEPLNPAMAPCDIHELLGYRLPNALYYYMCHGMISLQVINSLISGYIVESHPLCSGSSPAYRSFVKSSRLLEARAAALSLLTANLNRYFSSYNISAVNWFEKDVENLLPTSQIGSRWIKVIDSEKTENAPITRTSSWVNEAKKKQRTDVVDVKFCLKTLNSLSKISSGGKDPSAINPSTLSTPVIHPSTPHEITAVMLARFLEIQGYTRADGLEPSGQALLKALSSHPLSTSTLHNEELVTIFELIMHGCLEPPARKGPRLPADNHQLISQVLSVLTLQASPLQAFPGTFSRELLEFNSYVKVVNRSLRNIVEMVLLSLVLEVPRRDAEGVDAFVKTGFKSMYFAETGDCMGLLILEWFKILDESDGDVALATERAEGIFGGYCMGGFTAQFNSAVVFWLQVCDAVNCLCAADCVGKEFASAFNEAETWFKENR